MERLIEYGGIASLRPADTNEAELYAPPAPISSAVFDGAGLNDLTPGGTFTGTEPTRFKVVIDGEGTPDTINWTKDGGVTWEATGVSITGAAQTLENGISITFAATTGHSMGESWEFTVSMVEVNGVLRIVNQDTTFQTYGVAHTFASGAAAGKDWIIPDGKQISKLWTDEASIHAKYGEYIRVKSGAADKVSFHLSGQLITKMPD